jgi:DNA-binding SARP family transcriptional activator
MWPEHPDPRHNLRVTLSYLRRVIADTCGEASADGVVVADHSTVRLVPGPRLRCDVWEFETHLGAAATAERADDPAAALEGWGRALALWRGPAFADLTDCDELWRFGQAITTRMARAATRAGELWLANDQLDQALRAGELALSADPAHEPALRLVARCQVAAGNGAGAANTLRVGVEAVEQLGVEASEETVRLAREVNRRR